MRFGHPLLEAATGLSEAVLSDAVRPAVAAGVLVIDDDIYAFRHALVREAVYWPASCRESGGASATTMLQQVRGPNGQPLLS